MKRLIATMATVMLAALVSEVLAGPVEEVAQIAAPRVQALQDGNGAEAGVAFGYQGKPSWVLVTVDRDHRDQVQSAELITRDHRTIRLPGFELRPDGSWGGAIPVSLYDVAAIRLLGDSPGEVLQASVSWLCGAAAPSW